MMFFSTFSWQIMNLLQFNFCRTMAFFCALGIAHLNFQKYMVVFGYYLDMANYVVVLVPRNFYDFSNPYVRDFLFSKRMAKFLFLIF